MQSSQFAMSELRSWRGWLVVAAVSIISFILIGSTLASLGVYLPVFQTEFKWSEQDVGSVAAMLLVGVALSSVGAGWTLNKIGPRNLIMTGLTLTVGGCLFAARAQNLSHMLMAMGFVGAGLGAATIVPGATVINHWFKERRGVAMAVFISSLVLSASIIPRWTDSLIQAGDWRFAMTTLAVVTAVVGFGLAILVRLPPKQKSDEAVDPATPDEVTGMTVKEALKSPQFWFLISALTLVQLSINGILYNVISYLITLDFTSTKAVSTYSLANLCGLPGLFISGFLVDRFGATRIIPIAAFILAIGTFMLLGVDLQGEYGFIALAAFVGLWGLGSSLPSQIGPIILAELVGMRSFPTLMGVRGAVVSLIGATAPILVGVLFVVEGNYRLPFIVCGALALGAIPLFMLVRKPVGTSLI